MIKLRGKLLNQVLATDEMWRGLGVANPYRVVTPLTHIVRCTNDVSDVLPSVDQTGEAQVTHLDVSMGEWLRKQNVLRLKKKNIIYICVVIRQFLKDRFI